MLMLRNVLDDILVEILKLKLGLNFGQDIKVHRSLVKILKET